MATPASRPSATSTSAIPLSNVRSYPRKRHSRDDRRDKSTYRNRTTETTAAHFAQPHPSSTRLPEQTPTHQHNHNTPINLISDEEEEQPPPLPARFFATFDNRGSADFLANFDKLSITPPRRRIVVERDTSGSFVWKFVPPAVNDSGEAEEGPWPRFVEIHGPSMQETKLLSEDDWDSFKLDPRYRCYIPKDSGIPIVSLIKPAKASPANPHTTPELRAPRPKRDLSPSLPTTDERPRKRSRQTVTVVLDSDSDIEILDAPPSQASATPTSATREHPKPPSPKRPQNPSAPTPRPKDREMKEPPTSQPPKRKCPEPSPSTGQNSEINPAKRIRTKGPQDVQEELAQKKAQREKEKKKERDAREVQFRWLRDQLFWSQAESGGAGPQSQQAPDGDKLGTFPSQQQDDEAARMARIEESRRKLAELERDRPIWDEMARQRKLAEEKAEAAREAARLKKQQEEERARLLKEHHKLAEEHREKANKERMIREKTRAREREQWEHAFKRAKQPLGNKYIDKRLWTTHLALANYRNLSTAFDEAKYTTTEPLLIIDIPWPVLYPPNFSLKAVDWASVEAFFTQVQPLIPRGEWRDFLKASHIRFHPDKWRARGLFGPAGAGEEVEKVVEHVGKVMGSLWGNCKVL